MSDIYQELLDSYDSHPHYKPGDKVVLEVRFKNGGKTYCYTADEGVYRPGEIMIVYGDGSYKPVSIVRAHYFYPHDYPFESIRLKKAERPSSNNYLVPKTTTKEREPKSKDSQRITTASNTTYYSSGQESTQSKTKKRLIILAIIVALGLMQGPTWYRNYVNSSSLDTSEIYGEWSEDVYFNGDNTFSFRGDKYLSGRWAVQNSSENLIRLNYYVTPDQVDMYNQEYQYDMDGYIADREDVLEWESEAWSGEIPPEGTYRYIRSEKKLIFIEEPDYYILKQ